MTVSSTLGHEAVELPFVEQLVPVLAQEDEELPTLAGELQEFLLAGT
ncbi:hypothetical protein ACN47A_21225 [Myxococcus fulvus]